MLKLIKRRSWEQETLLLKNRTLPSSFFCHRWSQAQQLGHCAPLRLHWMNKQRSHRYTNRYIWLLRQEMKILFMLIPIPQSTMQKALRDVLRRGGLPAHRDPWISPATEKSKPPGKGKPQTVLGSCGLFIVQILHWANIFYPPTKDHSALGPEGYRIDKSDSIFNIKFQDLDLKWEHWRGAVWSWISADHSVGGDRGSNT